ncbi:MAG: FAD binding domain-containing protein [Pseudomonadota bacterium]
MLRVDTYPTAAEAARALGPGTRFLGGGSLVMIELNYGASDIDRIVRTSDPELKEIRVEAGRVHLGALVSMSDVLNSRDLDFLAPVAQAVGGPAVRSAASVGGNLFAPHPYGDFSVALLALDAMVQTADGVSHALEGYLADRSGLVTSVSFAAPAGNTFAFRKVRRVRPKGASVMSMACRLSRSAGRLSDVRVAYGAMGPTAVRAKAVEQALEGATLDERGIAPALERATEGLDPPTDALASSWYRKETAVVHLRRLLLAEDAR